MAERAVVVAITTYRRAAQLATLLDRVTAQVPELTGRPVRTVVVDNDPDASARSVAETHGWEYVLERSPGIAAARHAALATGAGRDLVVMLDDDLTPEPGWLAHLVAAWDAHHPTVVMGFVRYDWPAGTDPWLVAGGFFRRTAHPVGTPLRALATGNVLIDAADAAARGVQFDVSLGLAGGEDSAFGDAVLAAGGTIIGTSASVAREEIPSARATKEYVRRRTIGHGEQLAAQRIDAATGVTRVVRRGALFFGGAVRWVVFTGGGLVARVRGSVPAHAVYRRRAWFAIGRMRGALGRRRPEYARGA